MNVVAIVGLLGVIGYEGGHAVVSGHGQDHAAGRLGAADNAVIVCVKICAGADADFSIRLAAGQNVVV
jgi:hypothetical protein